MGPLSGGAGLSLRCHSVPRTPESHAGSQCIVCLFSSLFTHFYVSLKIKPELDVPTHRDRAQKRHFWVYFSPPRVSFCLTAETDFSQRGSLFSIYISPEKGTETGVLTFYLREKQTHTKKKRLCAWMVCYSAHGCCVSADKRRPGCGPSLETPSPLPAPGPVAPCLRGQC